MANVKDINMSGTLPFNYYEDDTLARLFAFITSPTSGLNVTWNSAGYKPNQHGGKTAIYEYHITGQEAVSWGWILYFNRAVTSFGGTVGENENIDIEG